MASILNKENYLQDAGYRLAIVEKLEELRIFRQEIIDRTARQRGKLVSEVKMRPTPYEYLLEHKMLNVDILLSECDKILNLKSELPSKVRIWLGDLYSVCMKIAIRRDVEKVSKKFKK